MSEKKQTVNVDGVKLDGDGFVSVIAQDYESGEVLLLSKMNAEALEKTFETGYAHYYCDKKKAALKYGATLGNMQKLKAAFVDENGTLLIKVRQTGKAAPELGAFSCFSKQIKIRKILSWISRRGQNSYYLVPKIRSPASPRPGMMYLSSFRWPSREPQ